MNRSLSAPVLQMCRPGGQGKGILPLPAGTGFGTEVIRLYPALSNP